MNVDYDTAGRGPRRVAIIGGGVTGLAAAFRLAQIAPSILVTVLDSGARPGGIIRTVQHHGLLADQSADSFITDPPDALAMCQALGMENQLVPTAQVHRRALVLCGGKLHSVPAGFVIMAPQKKASILNSPILSWAGKLRLLQEPLIPPRPTDIDDESVASFARRRLGDEAYERLVQPLVGGIYTADPTRLSMAATMARFFDAERKFGNIANAMAQNSRHTSRFSDRDSASASGARYGMFMAPHGGMESIISTLVGAIPLGSVRSQCHVTSIERFKGMWRIGLLDHNKPRSLDADAVLLTTSADVASRLVNGVSPALSAELQAIEAAGATVVCVGFRRDQIVHPLDAFGLVIPIVEQRRILSVSFSSQKFAGRAPQQCVLLRVFMGGALQPEMANLSDDQARKVVKQELHDLLGVTGEPFYWEIARWHGAMPQYHVGHLQRIARIEAEVQRLPGLELAGNSYRGVGIAHCVRQADAAAERIASRLLGPLT